MMFGEIWGHVLDIFRVFTLTPNIPKYSNIFCQILCMFVFAF